MNGETITLGELPQRAARLWGKRDAITVGGRTISFDALNDLAAVVAGGLRAHGIERGDRVTLAMANSIDWLACYYGVARMGGVVNALSSMLTPTEIVFAVVDCSARVVIGPAAKVSAVARELTGILAVSTDGPAPGLVDLAVLMTDGTGGADDTLEAVPADAVAVVIYTSGTTGNPKGAMLSHRAAVLNASMTAQMHGRSTADTVLTALPCTHVYGMAVLNSAMLAGQHLVMMPRFDAATALQLVEHHRVTILDGVPTMYLMMLECPGVSDIDFSSLTRCTVGGQTMPTAKMGDVERLFGCPLIELWGMTEIAGLGTTFPSLGPRTPGSIGIALPWTEVQIASLGDEAVRAPPGEVGELVVRGPTVMDGYWNNEAATREAIGPGGWLRTGDLAYMDARGQFFIVDRKKDLIISGGYNVYPAELERVISDHPSVAMVAVGRIPDAEKGELAKAYVVAKAGHVIDSRELGSYCRERLAPYKCPRRIAIVSELPTTSTGKIMRRALHRLDDQ